MHVHKNPLLLGTLPPVEGSLDLFIPAFASQAKADPTKDYLGVVVPEKARIQRDSQPALA
jgi:hypothetical protein